MRGKSLAVAVRPISSPRKTYEAYNDITSNDAGESISLRNLLNI